MPAKKNFFAALMGKEAEKLDQEVADDENARRESAAAASSAGKAAAGSNGALDKPLVWVDCEMSGLDFQNDVILQIAVIVTDGNLDVIKEGPEITIHHPEEVLEGMNEWCVEHHGASGLTQAVRESTVSMAEAEQQVLAFIKTYVSEPNTAVLAGNSVHADLAFLRKDMPSIPDYLHYRIVDVSTIGELCRRWFPREAARAPKKKNAHTAMSDIRESILQLKYYRKHVFKVHARWNVMHLGFCSYFTALAQLPSLKQGGTDKAAGATASALPASRSYLRELYIQDFALVAAQRVAFAPGLNVVTGESGSGKSVLVEALQQILGAPASEDCLRPPATSALLEGVLEVADADAAALAALLRELGVPQRAIRAGPGPLTLRREIVKVEDGVRSRCSLNGSPTSLRVLREVGRLLVDVNGQHAALSLRDSSTQLALLDRIAGTSGAAARLADVVAAWQAAQAQLRSLDALADAGEREAMQALVDQVAEAGLEPGEDVRLRRHLRQLDARRSATERCRLVSTALDDPATGAGVLGALRDVEGNIRSILSQEQRLAAQAEAEAEEARRASGGAAAAQVEEEDELQEGSGRRGQAADGDEEEWGRPSVELLEQAMGLLDQAAEVLGEAECAVEQWARQYRFSQAEHDEASARLQLLERLLRQHDAFSVDELLEAAAEKEAALDDWFQMEGRREELEASAAELGEQVRAQAVALSAARRGAAGQLRQAVETVLRELAMAGARFEVRISWTQAADSSSGRGATPSSRDTSSLELGEEQASSCWEGAGRYRLRAGGAGLDTAEYLFAAGPSEPLRPLAAVASGGESARIMLALKAAPTLVSAAAAAGGAAAAAVSDDAAAAAEAQASTSAAAVGLGSPLLVLDEIDSGVGSRLGQPVGRLLRSMAGSAVGQILCVSHLPQVAAHAANHLCVRKQEEGGHAGRLVTSFESLTGREERLAEIQAMLGLPRLAAEEVLAAAESNK